MKQLVSVFLVTWAFSLAGMSQTGTPTKGGPNATLTGGGPLNADQKGQQLPAGLDYVIGPEDVLDIRVLGEDQLSTKVTVRADGKISLLLLDEIPAAGLTTVRLKETITQGLKKFLTDPHVFVNPVEIHSQYVSVGGNVAKPGRYPLGGSLRVTELLVRAGGLLDFAKSDRILIVREQGTHTNRFLFNYKSYLQGKNVKQDIQLQNHDMVIVP
jgi:polysaccharide export outer membrane protein